MCAWTLPWVHKTFIRFLCNALAMLMVSGTSRPRDDCCAGGLQREICIYMISSNFTSMIKNDIFALHINDDKGHSLVSMIMGLFLPLTRMTLTVFGMELL